jgi:hypothetical protein
MLIGNYQSTSSALAHTLVALHLVTATAFAASAPVDGLRWTAEDLPLPGGVSSLVATGSTKEGVIIAHGLKSGAVYSFIYMPSAAYGLAAGWNDLGPARQREMPTTAIAASALSEHRLQRLEANWSSAWQSRVHTTSAASESRH